MIDLHLHSNCSDGVLPPDKLVTACKAVGLSTIALCDHDTVCGVSLAMETGQQLAVEVISGVELSVCHKDISDIHLLGYWIDHNAPLLQTHLDTLATQRANRNREIIGLINQRLRKECKDPLQVVEVEALADGVIGRPHIARVLIRQGYVSGMEEAFRRYLIPCDVPKAYWPMESAIVTIQNIGGIAILAHPTSISRDQQFLAALIAELKTMGLDGIEVFNSLATEQETMFLQKLAYHLDLLVTGGSDYHGIEPDDCIGKGRGGIRFADALLPPLRQRADERQIPCSRFFVL